MTKQLDVTIPMDQVLDGRLRENSAPREVEILTEEIKEGNFLIRLKFDPGSLARKVFIDPFEDEDFVGVMGMTD